MRLLRFAGAKVLTRLPAAQDLAGVRLIVPGSTNAAAAKDVKVPSCLISQCCTHCFCFWQAFSFAC